MTSEAKAEQFLNQAEPTVYKYDLEFLTSLFDQHAADQRQRCSNRVLLLCNPEQDEELRDACLNATGESNDKQ